MCCVRPVWARSKIHTLSFNDVHNCTRSQCSSSQQMVSLKGQLLAFMVAAWLSLGLMDCFYKIHLMERCGLLLWRCSIKRRCLPTLCCLSSLSPLSFPSGSVLLSVYFLARSRGSNLLQYQVFPGKDAVWSRLLTTQHVSFCAQQSVEAQIIHFKRLKVDNEYFLK